MTAPCASRTVERVQTVPWRPLLGGLGRVLLGAGVLVLLFVAYQLWGTALHEARAQDDLRSEFAAALEAATVAPRDPSPAPDPPVGSASAPTASSTSAPSTTPVAPVATPPDPEATAPSPTAVAFLADLDEGDPVARIEIPAVGVDKVVVSGVGVEELKAGPGHYPNTPLPGQAGNAAIAGHRTTYGAPFAPLDELRPGDGITVTTVQGRFAYRVRETTVVSPDAVEILDPTDDDRLTLTTCHPRFTARERLVVVADLVSTPGRAVPPTPGLAPSLPSQTVPQAEPVPSTPGPAVPPTPGPATPLPSQTVPQTDTVPPTPGLAPSLPSETVPRTEPVPAPDGTVPQAEAVPAPVPAVTASGPPEAGLSGASAARTPVVTWAVICAALGLAVWLVGRAWRRWITYLIALPLVVVALLNLFESVALLLPANA